MRAVGVLIIKIFSELSPKYFIIFSSGIPDKGNKAEIILTVLHRNFLGVDEFLGRVSLPLSGFDHQEKARSKYEVSLVMVRNVLS